jgi:uncharacterized phiE125 gp8 family phage protein
MTGLKLVTAPTVEPVTLAEAKLFAKVDLADDDALISALIVAARQKAEAYTRRAFVTQTWELFIDGVPGLASDDIDNLPRGWPWTLTYPGYGYIALPRPPLISVTSVKYYSLSDAETPWASSNYVVDTHSEPGRIMLASSKTWPSSLRPYNSILVRFVAGYGATAADVPDAIKTGIKLVVAHWYENRESEEIPPEARRILDAYKVMML